MLTLNDGRSELWQWDTGRKLTVDADCTQVHFSNKFFGRSVDVDVFDGTAEIPDVLLQVDKDLLVWAFVGTAENGYTKISKVFKVNKRNKPADYVFTPTEQTTLGKLIERLDKIEESQDPDAIKNAVDDYLANNPIVIDETDPTVPDWAKQPIKPKYTAKEVGAVATVNGQTPDENGNVEITIPGSGGNVDLTGYAKEQWVQQNYQPKGEYLTAVPDGYAKTEDIPTKPEDIGAQPSGNYALKTEIPSIPVQSVNGKTGAVKLSASDVGARPSNWMPTAQEVGALPDTYVPPDQTAAQVGADPAGTAAAAVSAHNTSTDSHGDLRLALKAINDRLTAFFDSDNQTLDELSEIVAYITSNKALIDSITTSKVSVADIINNLTTNVANKPLSAAQGVALKGLIDAVGNSLSNYQPKGDYALRSELPTVPTKVSQLQNDKGYLTEHQDISGKLDADKLPEAVNAALAQAKDSGEFDGEKGDPGAPGENGTSVTVKSVSESTADGGNNVVTFSDGNTLTVKNGSKGNKGDAYKLNDTDKDTIVNAVIAANSLPDYWLTHLSAKIPSINTAMESAGRNKSAFYFYTDAHRISSANMTPAILRYLYRHTSINKTNNGGDFFEPFATGADNLATMRNYMADMRSTPNHHSVIGNHDEDNESLASDTQLYGFYLAWEENNDIVWGGYNYYYIDNKAENTRYLYLDIGKNFGKTGAIMVSNEQMQFVIDSLASLPKGWHAVPIAHIWYDYEISAIPDYVLNVLAVFDAYNGRTTGSVTHNGSKFDYDFAEAVGNVEFCIGGHCHADQVHYSNGGIPIIITDTDSTARKGSAATLGTITEGCIDAVVADYNSRKIKLIRIGRGADRTINIPAYQPEGPEEIVNILNVYNIQYNKRYSPTSQGYKDANGIIAFSIPLADVWGKTIYFKGFSNITNNSSGQVSAWYYAEDESTTVRTFSGTTNSNVFTATALQVNNGVYSIAVDNNTTGDSAFASASDRLQIQMVMTAGTAVSAADLANCVMTIDQPIE